jgi:type I restriction enzyme M protein
MIVSLVDPQPGRRICDPACGTAGFLIAAYQHILRAHTSKASLAKGIVDGQKLEPRQWKFLEERAFTGYDNDANMVKIAILNLYLHALAKALTDSRHYGESFDVILANPPFAGKIQKESILADINLPTRDTELLFVKWFVDHLTPGGRGGVIVPTGVLFGGKKAACKVRELLMTECDLQAVVNIPSGVFKPYAGVSTSALIFEKGKKTESVWFYDLTADGYSLDDKRTPIEANDIPDLQAKWEKRDEGPNSYRVPIEKIRKNDWSLAAGRYKSVTVETANHDKPKEILEGVLKLENEITKLGDALLAKIRAKR